MIFLESGFLSTRFGSFFDALDFNPQDSGKITGIYVNSPGSGIFLSLDFLSRFFLVGRDIPTKCQLWIELKKLFLNPLVFCRYFETTESVFRY